MQSDRAYNLIHLQKIMSECMFVNTMMDMLLMVYQSFFTYISLHENMLPLYFLSRCYEVFRWVRPHCMSATREKMVWHRIFGDNHIVLKFGVIDGMPYLGSFMVTLLTIYRLERSLVPAKAYA